MSEFITGIETKQGVKKYDFQALGNFPACAVGQLLKVTAVDENGQPTGWEAVTAAAASHNHAAGAITSGVFPVSRGGTNKTSWTPNRLVYPSAATTLAQLAFPSSAGSVLRQGTSGAPYWTSLADLAEALGVVSGAAAKIATGSYVGTGTYGADNPCSLTFDFVPEIIFIVVDGSGELGMMWFGASKGDDFVAGTYARFYVASVGTQGEIMLRAQQLTKTINNIAYWYSTINAEQQFNLLDTKYYYVAFGF